MNALEKRYESLCQTPSDINEHLPILKAYAEKCNHITELGVRGAASTTALLMGSPITMVSYDIVDCPVQSLYSMVEKETDFSFVIANSLNIVIDYTDLLFIDTIHNYRQLSEELRLHAGKVNKFIILHDTTSYENHGESYEGKPEEGLWKAVKEFLEAHPEWKLHARYFNNNGLTILKRT